MSDYISRSELTKRIDKWFCKPCEDSGKNRHNVMCGSCDIDAVLSWLDAIPAADVVEVKHGEWEQIDVQPYFRKHYSIGNNACSICHHKGMKDWNHCPHCGAKMDGGET